MTCGQDCAAPAKCALLPETCNLQDDDCDGFVDENLQDVLGEPTIVADDDVVPTQYRLASDDASFVAAYVPQRSPGEVQLVVCNDEGLVEIGPLIVNQAEQPVQVTALAAARGLALVAWAIDDPLANRSVQVAMVDLAEGSIEPAADESLGSEGASMMLSMTATADGFLMVMGMLRSLGGGEYQTWSLVRGFDTAGTLTHVGDPLDDLRLLSVAASSTRGTAVATGTDSIGTALVVALETDGSLIDVPAAIDHDWRQALWSSACADDEMGMALFSGDFEGGAASYITVPVAGVLDIGNVLVHDDTRVFPVACSAREALTSTDGFGWMTRLNALGQTNGGPLGWPRVAQSVGLYIPSWSGRQYGVLYEDEHADGGPRLLLGRIGCPL